MLDSRIKDHLQRLVKYLNALKDIKKHSKEEFLENGILEASSERYLQLSIESCLNIGNRIISLEQFDKEISAPETYADIFRILAKIGVIENEFSDKLVKMAKFRNRLVHIYWDIDKEEMYNIIQTNLGDFEKFIECVIQYYNKKA